MLMTVARTKIDLATETKKIVLRTNPLLTLLPKYVYVRRDSNWLSGSIR